MNPTLLDIFCLLPNWKPLHILLAIVALFVCFFRSGRGEIVCLKIYSSPTLRPWMDLPSQTKRLWANKTQWHFYWECGNKGGWRRPWEDDGTGTAAATFRLKPENTYITPTLVCSFKISLSSLSPTMAEFLLDLFLLNLKKSSLQCQELYKSQSVSQVSQMLVMFTCLFMCTISASSIYNQPIFLISLLI